MSLAAGHSLYGVSATATESVTPASAMTGASMPPSVVNIAAAPGAASSAADEDEGLQVAATGTPVALPTVPTLPPHTYTFAHSGSAAVGLDAVGSRGPEAR